MENTQSFNTPRGIQAVKTDFQKFQQNLQGGRRTRAAHDYNQIYQDTFLFPPCNIVNSLRDDLSNYRTSNIFSDVKVIMNEKSKLKY